MSQGKLCASKINSCHIDRLKVNKFQIKKIQSDNYYCNSWGLLQRYTGTYIISLGVYTLGNYSSGLLWMQAYVVMKDQWSHTQVPSPTSFWSCLICLCHKLLKVSLFPVFSHYPQFPISTYAFVCFNTICCHSSLGFCIRTCVHCITKLCWNPLCHQISPL